MAHYFFHIRRDGILIEDLEGDEFVDDTAALREAQSAARDLVVNAIQTGRLVDDSRIEVWNAADASVGVVELVDVLPIRRRSRHRES